MPITGVSISVISKSRTILLLWLEINVMKKAFLTISLLIIFNSSFAQYAAEVKKAATAMLHADVTKNYNAYVDCFYPSEIKSRGGKAKFIQAMKSREPGLKLVGMSMPKKSLGKVSKFYRAGKELHCTIESFTKFKYPDGKTSLNISHYLAISSDAGKNWKFIMTGGKTPSQVWAMVPKFNENLTWVDYNE
jgi:hypothetical protein